MASRSINVHTPFPMPARTASSFTSSSSSSSAISVAMPSGDHRYDAGRVAAVSRGNVICMATQESSTATVSDKKEGEAMAATTPAAAAKEAPEKPKKAAAKGLPETMEEEIIPALKATLEAQQDLSQIEISFQDNRLEGSFLKNDTPYFFWAFFPDGTLTGPKGFSLCSAGTGPSTVEPFLIDEKKVTTKHVVFWVEKRLAAQGILPVWDKE